MARSIRIDNNTSFNPETGEISSTSNSSYQPPPSSGNRNSQNNNSDGWIWVILLIILGVLGYYIYTSNSKKEPSISSNTNQNSSSQNSYPNTTATPIETVNPYGFGNGKLTVYKTCEYCPDLEVSIDGNKIGTISSTFRDGVPSCDDSATISTILTTGEHNLYAKDAYGTVWDFKVTMTEGECKSQAISKNDDSKPNPYGKGNGKMTFYKTCNYCPNLKVWIDGNYEGVLSQILSGDISPECEQYGTISTVLSAGSHSLFGKDDYGITWDLKFDVTEAECNSFKLFKTDDSKPNPYGYGNGKVTFYKTCTYCPVLSISIDGYYIGTLSKTFDDYNRPTCDEYGTVSKVLSAGNHQIQGSDSYGTTWNFQFSVTEGECSLQGLKKTNDTKPNPYGYGNGKISFWTNESQAYDIYIDGYYQGSLRSYFNNGAPNCGQDGTFSLVVSSGTSHTLIAKNNRIQWSGQFTVSEGECQLMRVNGY